MALKSQVKSADDYLDKLCEENGIEIIIPDLDKEESDEEETEKENILD